MRLTILALGACGGATWPQAAIDKDCVLAKVRIVAKVTSKLQVTIPKAIADAHGIEPGAELVFESAGDVIRVRRARQRVPSDAAARRERIRAFDEAAKRQVARDLQLRDVHQDLFTTVERGWRREELYGRGVPR